MPISPEKAQRVLNALVQSYNDVIAGQGERTIADVIESTLQWFEKTLPGQFTREEILAIWLHQSLDQLMSRDQSQECRIITLQ